MPMLRLPLPEWNRRRLVNLNRAEALERLYARKDAVDDLIRALEEYQALTPIRQAECIPLARALKYS
jgi:hypothetical protein